MFSGQRLKKRREELGLSQSDLAKKLGISRASYFNWESGKTQPNQKNLLALAQSLGTHLSYFEAYAPLLDVYAQLLPKNQEKTLDYAQDLLRQQDQDESQPLYAYQVYERLSAGPGYSYIEDRAYDLVYGTQEIDHDLASWVSGDSMEPLYLNGSVALIKDTGFDYDGAVYAVDWDGQTYIKKVYREKEGLRLVSINDKYRDRFAPYSEEPRILGKIVGNFMPLDY